MKKLIVSFLFVLALMFAMSFVTFAMKEIEPNDSVKTATQISVNTTVSGSLARSNDVDWYQFTVAQDGYFCVDFDHELIDSGSSFWRINLYDSTGVNSIDGSDSYFSYFGKSVGATNYFGVKAGTYYVKISTGYHSSIPYRFTVRFTASNRWETENNNSRDKADDINANETYHGSLSSGDDVDWYKFTVAQDGYFYVDFNHDLIDSTDDYWRIHFYDATGVSFVDGNDSYFSSYGKSTGASNPFGIKAGTYYMKISSGYGYSGIPYDFFVKFTASNRWETENNNSKDKADVIDVSKTYYGALTTDGDVDWYSFTVPSSCDIAIAFNHEAIDSGDTYWKLYLYDNTGVTELFYWELKGNTAAATSDYISVSPGKYYIKVRSDSYSGDQYSLVVHEKHDCVGDFKIIKAPTCTESGTKEKYCTICGEFLDRQTIPANGHTSDNWVIDKEATCSAEGERHFKCSACGEMISETIPALAHTMGEWKAVEATKCYADRIQMRKCLKCDYSETETLPMLTHEFGEWTVVSGNKLIPPIVKEKTCVHCGEVQSVKDWSYIWVTIIAGVVAIGVVIGIISYIRAFKRK